MNTLTGQIQLTASADSIIYSPSRFIARGALMVELSFDDSISPGMADAMLKAVTADQQCYSLMPVRNLDFFTAPPSIDHSIELLSGKVVLKLTAPDIDRALMQSASRELLTLLAKLGQEVLDQFYAFADNDKLSTRLLLALDLKQNRSSEEIQDRRMIRHDYRDPHKSRLYD